MTETVTPNERWHIEGNSIVWDVANDTNLPHEDHIEMSGRRVSVIVRYRVEADRTLHLTREIIWPMLRMKEGDVRGYLKRTFTGLISTPIFVNGNLWKPQPVTQIAIKNGMFMVETASEEVETLATVIAEGNSVVTSCILKGSQPGRAKITVSIEDIGNSVVEQTETDSGVYGDYHISRMVGTTPIGDWADTVMENISGRLDGEQAQWDSGGDRLSLVQSIWSRLILETPDEAINTEFTFAKLRAAESLFETKMGLVHSPGGGRYYGGVWNNDQCEYSGPFFGYLGDADARLAALNAYRKFVPYMTLEYKPLPSSLEMEGTIPWCGAGDRGDAAMYASGAARFALATGDLAVAEELCHHIEWCLEYSRRQLNEHGVVASDSDELENRFPSGDANLCTSCLFYDGLMRMADLARDLSRFEDATEYETEAKALAVAIEQYFGATVEGFDTYRYYDGNETLRAWICLPLTFGVSAAARIPGTLDALFSPRLWGPDGLATEAGKPDFWDRSTLYALRGAFFAGDTERAFAHLSSYTRRRLLGEHVPYPVEAYPEGGQAHLSAESALYCRAVVEGMFGLVPTGLCAFSLTPRLPEAWDRMALRQVHAFGHVFDIVVRCEGEVIHMSVVSDGGETLYEATVPRDTTCQIGLPFVASGDGEAT